MITDEFSILCGGDDVYHMDFVSNALTKFGGRGLSFNTQHYLNSQISNILNEEKTH